MRWTRSLLVVALAAAPCSLSAQTHPGDHTGGQPNAVEETATPAPPPARKSLMGMVMAALIQSAEQGRQQTLARAVTDRKTLEPGAPDTFEARAPGPKSTTALEDTPQAQVALHADDIP